VELYPALKLLHVGCVLVTASGFVLRGVWMLRDNPLLRHPLTRVLPHVNDTLLLAAGIGMALLLRQYPLVDGWLTAKLIALLAYIGLGTVALKRGQTKRIRLLAFGGALLTLAYLVAVALARSPWPMLPGAHGAPHGWKSGLEAAHRVASPQAPSVKALLGTMERPVTAEVACLNRTPPEGGVRHCSRGPGNQRWTVPGPTTTPGSIPCMSGRRWAMPLWQSMQVLPSSKPFWCASMPRCPCFV
jgi:uncharacterized membrane protein SirB2